MSLQLYQVDSRTYLLDFRSIDGKFELQCCVLITFTEMCSEKRKKKIKKILPYITYLQK